MHFTRIKFSEQAKKVTLEWTETKPSGDSISHSLDSTDAPRPELLAALEALRPFVVKICEYAGKWGDTIRPTGLVISEKDDVRGIVITATRALELTSAPLAMNTPNLVEEKWPEGLATALETLEAEATQFVNGKRAQQELFEGNGKAEAEPEKPRRRKPTPDEQQEIRAHVESGR